VRRAACAAPAVTQAAAAPRACAAGAAVTAARVVTGGAAVGGAAHGDLSVVMSGGGGGGMGTRLDYYTGTYCIAPPGAGGGGAVELTARGVLTLDGVVSARGGDAGGGGGAGGGVLVSGHGGSTCAGTLDASGGSSSSNSGGGGGGRVLLVGVDGSTCAVAVPGGGTAGGQGGGSGTWSALDPDDDGDGWTRIAGHDCDDLDSAIHPGAAELAGDGVDQDCDGSDGAAVDADGDGYPAPFDCDDTDVRLYPGAVEVVGDGLDQDCDGAESCYVDADDDGARSVSVVISIDVDCADPFEGVAPDPLDCNDTDPNVRPAAADLPCDGIDQDCDSLDLCEQHTGDTGDTGSTGSHTGAHTGVAAHTGRAIPHSGTAGGDTGHTGLEPSTGTDGPPTPESPRPGEFHAAGCASTGPAGVRRVVVGGGGPRDAARSSMIEPVPSPPGRRFQLEECLGRGGFGEVYRATMTSPSGIQSQVAVKVLHGDLDDASDALDRLRDEGRLLGLLDHPSIVRVIDLCRLEGRIALVTEYVMGADLKRCIRGSQPMPPAAVAEVVARLADALDTAWKTSAPDGTPLQLVHRDVKPANVRIGRRGEVKLLDFGIARASLRLTRTATNLLVGSFGYLAPERLSVRPDVGPAADVFSLGCVWYEALTHRGLLTELEQPTQVALSMSPPRLPGLRPRAHGRARGPGARAGHRDVGPRPGRPAHRRRRQPRRRVDARVGRGPLLAALVPGPRLERGQHVQRQPARGGPARGGHHDPEGAAGPVGGPGAGGRAPCPGRRPPDRAGDGAVRRRGRPPGDPVVSPAPVHDGQRQRLHDPARAGGDGRRRVDRGVRRRGGGRGGAAGGGGAGRRGVRPVGGRRRAPRGGHVWGGGRGAPGGGRGAPGGGRGAPRRRSRRPRWRPRSLRSRPSHRSRRRASRSPSLGRAPPRPPRPDPWAS
jgi:hypothetical protein